MFKRFAGKYVVNAPDNGSVVVLNGGENVELTLPVRASLVVHAGKGFVQASNGSAAGCRLSFRCRLNRPKRFGASTRCPRFLARASREMNTLAVSASQAGRMWPPSQPVPRIRTVWHYRKGPNRGRRAASHKGLYQPPVADGRNDSRPSLGLQANWRQRRTVAVRDSGRKPHQPHAPTNHIPRKNLSDSQTAYGIERHRAPRLRDNIGVRGGRSSL